MKEILQQILTRIKILKINLKINLQKQIELVVNIIPIIKNNNKNIIINNSN